MMISQHDMQLWTSQLVFLATILLVCHHIMSIMSPILVDLFLTMFAREISIHDGTPNFESFVMNVYIFIAPTTCLYRSFKISPQIVSLPWHATCVLAGGHFREELLVFTC
jgi:hypothetical protein